MTVWLGSDAVFATVAAQAVGAVVLAVLIRSFHRQYGKAYLRHWAVSWTSLAVFGVTTLALRAPELWSLGSLGSVFVVGLRGVSGFLHAGFLALGFWELTMGRQAPRRFVTQMVVALVVVGVVVPFAGWFRGAAKAGGVVLEPIGAGAVGAGLTILGLWMIARRHLMHGIGMRLASWALVAYGVHQLHYAGFRVAEIAVGPLAGYGFWLTYASFLLQMIVGFGMISSLLEEERHAAYLATREIEHVAYHDALTGLPNRPLFLDRLIVALAQGARHGYKVAVFFLDVDHFKDINDTLGHSYGDALLKELADRIRRCVRAGDTVARFGGDEFTIFVQNISWVEDIARVAEKLLATVKQPVRIGGEELFVSVSVGVSFFPLDGADPETLLKNADAAMYRAKEQGRDNYQIYAPAMNACAVERLSLENQLRRALELNELAVYYQPLVQLDTRAMFGAEALLRWKRSDGHVAPPGDFIRTLESSGLIIPVGDWVLERACQEAVGWTNGNDVAVTLSVNLAARQFQRADLPERVDAILKQTGLDPERLELEITESCAMQNVDNSVRVLNELKRMGVRIALDDFGTGYSSLNYLRRFPIDTLKLDKSFVHDVTDEAGDAAIASAVISMAQSLGLTVIAEGIETEEQLAFLRALGCPRGQGFLFGYPIPSEEFAAYVQRSRSSVAAATREPMAV